MKQVLKDNKGYMLVEIIIASVISFVMVYFLMDITIKLVNKNNDYYIDSILLSDKNIVTKEIMDDINSKKLVSVTENGNTSVTLGFDDNTTKLLSVDGYVISYGDYKKELSKDLNIGAINIVKDNSILILSISAYTNYSKEDYGIKIVAPYSSDSVVEYPE